MLYMTYPKPPNLNSAPDVSESDGSCRADDSLRLLSSQMGGRAWESEPGLALGLWVPSFGLSEI